VCLFVARPLLPSEGTAGSSDALLFVLLSVVLVAVWALRVLQRSDGRARFDIVDLTIVFLVAWQGVAAYLAIDTGAPRPAVNAAWQWVSLAAMFFLVRQLVTSARELRAIAAVMVALAVTMSVFGFHQYFYSIPRDQAMFHENPEAALREAHISAPPGSRQRLLFEQRVNSSEPMATFALANSLAAFLVPWSIVALGICASAAVMRARDARVWLPAAIAALTCLACLVLTKSRSGFVAIAAGIAGVALWTIVQGAVISRRTLIAAAIIAVTLVVAAIGIGALDREVVSEAGKSLGYRLQYWQATCAMIADHPWFGCGPGQFQGCYTQYMLPEASETVADPHNFLLEVGGTAGVPAALALLLAIGLIAWRVVKPQAALIDEPTEDRPYYVYTGAGAGFVFALFIGPLATVPLGTAACAIGLLTSVIVVAALDPWLRSGRMTAGLLTIAAGAMLINLLASGGINFAGVAGSLWLLSGLALASTEKARPISKLATVAIFALAIGLGGTFFYTVYSPVLACNAALDMADVETEQAETHLRAARAADPLNAEPPKRMAVLEWLHWQSHPSAATFDRFMTSIDETERLDPHSAPLAELKGDICHEVHRRTREARPLELAIASFERATALYPNSGTTHAKLALAWADAGKTEQARAEAVRAIVLNDLTRHSDQKLPAEMVERLQSLAGPAN
jgi:O-antigen ligase